MKNIFMFLLVFPLLLYSCGGGTSLYPHKVKFTISPLHYEITEDIATVVDSVFAITPEATDRSLLSHIKKIVVTPRGEFVVLDKNGVYHFTNDGRFVRTYGSKGRGPGEYIALTDVGINAISGDLFLLDAMNKVLIFDSASGEFKRKITPDWMVKALSLDGIMPKSDGGFYLFSANPAFTKSDYDYLGLHEFNAAGQKIAEYLPNREFIIGLGAVSYGCDNTYLIRPLDNSNTVYIVSPKGVESFARIDFGDLNAPAGTIYNTAGEQDLAGFFGSKYYKNPCYFQQTDSHVSFQYVGADFESASVLFFKKNRRGIRYQAPDKKTFPLNFTASDGEFMYASFDKYTDEGLSERADPLTRYLVSKIGFAEIEQNPMIVGVKFKD